MVRSAAARDAGILGLLWLAVAIHDRVWFGRDRHIPAWDQSNHLTGALNHLHALQNLQWTADWWRSFWQLSHKYPPLTYILSAPFQHCFGVGFDQATLINLLLLAMLFGLIYALGRHLCDRAVGLWAAAICVLMPNLYYRRLDYLLDSTVVTFAIAAFFALTLWRDAQTRRGQWLWTVAFGLALGLGLMSKQSVMFFLFVPLLWVSLGNLWRRNWEKIAQLLTSFLVSLPLWIPWYRTNFIYLFSTSHNANATPASAEGDPPLNTWAAWTFYWRQLPESVSWVLLIVPLVGFLIYGWRKLLREAPIPRSAPPFQAEVGSETENLLLGGVPRRGEVGSPLVDEKVNEQKWHTAKNLGWLLLYLGGSYLICSAIFNKDPRFIMPYLPILAILLAYGLNAWRWQWVKGGAIALAALVMICKTYPIPGTSAIAQVLSPSWQHYPVRERPVPIADIVATVIETAPYLRSTVGVIPSGTALNHNTFNYFGNRANFQVYGRELGGSDDHLAQDARSHTWLITQTPDHTVAKPEQIALGANLRGNRTFKPIKKWQTTQGETVTLYHRRTPPTQVIPIAHYVDFVTLDAIKIPEIVPPGQPFPVTYQWEGQWSTLNSGIVLLSWVNIEDKNQFWLQDHAFGFGHLYAPEVNPDQSFQVIENTATFPPENLPAGTYQLQAKYLDRATGKTQNLPIPQITIQLDRAAPSLPAPELDYVSQLFDLAQGLPLGIPGLDPIFQQIGRLNQYDPVQDYLQQAELALSARLEQDPENLSYLYALALAHGLQEDAPETLAVFAKIRAIAPENPFHHAYVGFVNLYLWRPGAAKVAIQDAIAADPENEEFQALDGIASLMQGNLVQAWRKLAPVL